MADADLGMSASDQGGACDDDVWLRPGEATAAALTSLLPCNRVSNNQTRPHGSYHLQQ
jgi:hypothetical protein